MNEATYLLVLDSVRLPDAKSVCAKHQLDWLPLYLGTDWEPQLDLSPICIPVTKHDAIYQKWLSDNDWATSGVLFEYSSSVDFKQQLQALQSLITIKSEDGRLFLFRFYSPDTLIKLEKQSSSSFLSHLIAPATAVHLSPIVAEDEQSTSFYSTYQTRSPSKCIIPAELVELLLS